MDRLPKETMQQYRGRVKREINAANDALNLQPGEPIRYGSRDTRYRPGMLDKHRPTKITRLNGEALDTFLKLEKERQDHDTKIRAWRAEHEKFRARQDVKDADTIRHLIEGEPEKIIDRLTPAEWAAFRQKLEA